MLPSPAWMLCALLAWGGSEPMAPPTKAQVLWQRGQDLLRNGDSEKAISCFQESLQSDPELACNHLSLAAAYADLGKDNLAVAHLGRYVAKQPQHLAARLQYADLLLQAEQPQAARAQYERYLADAQDHEEVAGDAVVHAITSLVAIYAAQGDDYREHLNRGLGLYQLACQRAALPDPGGELSVEGLLFRAAAELLAARQLREDEARACWYLHLVWARLGRHQPAARWLRAAEAAAPLSELTPAEMRDLHLAWRHFPPARPK